MNHLIKFDLQIQLEPESGYEFCYYTFDSLPQIETNELSRNTEKWKSTL